MLRLPASKLQLTVRDHNWHAQRREHRMQRNAITSQHDSQPPRISSRKANSPIFFNELVPDDSDAYWHRLITSISSSIQLPPLQGSDEYSHLHSTDSGASSSSESWNLGEPCETSSLFGSSSISLSGFHANMSTRELLQPRNTSSGEEEGREKTGDELSTRLHELQLSKRGRQPSIEPRTYFVPRSPNQEFYRLDGNATDRANLDGPYEHLQESNRSSMVPQRTVPRYSGERDVLISSPPRSPQSLPSSPPHSLMPISFDTEDLPLDSRTSRPAIPFSMSSPNIPSFTRLRSRSGHQVPRSPLYISQAAASSSPERPATQTVTSTAPVYRLNAPAVATMFHTSESSRMHSPPLTPPNTVFRIYDDGLPASTQPQTPLNLPRNGIAGMPGPYTAPLPRNNQGRLGLPDESDGETEEPRTPTRRRRWVSGRFRSGTTGDIEGGRNTRGVMGDIINDANPRRERRGTFLPEVEGRTPI